MGDLSEFRDLVRGFVEKGWNFSVKTVSDRKYITARKRQEERGLGSFTDENWRIVEDLLKEDKRESEDKKRREELVKGLLETEEELLKALEAYRGAYMLSTCSHRVDGWCTYWKYREKPDFFRLLDTITGPESYKKIVVDKGESWIVKPIGLYCINCSGYTK